MLLTSNHILYTIDYHIICLLNGNLGITWTVQHCYVFRPGLCVSPTLTSHKPSYKSTTVTCINLARPLMVRPQLIQMPTHPYFKTFVLAGACGMIWLLWPCDTLETGISVLMLWVPALLQRLGSHPEIRGLICFQGFEMIYNHPPTVSGFICVLILSALVQRFTSGLMSPAAFLHSANASEAKNCLSSGHLRYWFWFANFIVLVNRLVYL